MEARLRARTRVEHPVGSLRPAAVLIALVERAGETHVLITRRTEKLREHAGQYAFPGGRRDPEDTDVVANALREAHEEVGLRPADVRVLGLLDDYPTVTDYLVTPVVGWIPSGYAYVTSPDEVALVLELPLRAFVEKPKAVTMAFRGQRRIALTYVVGEHHVWGATASMLRGLAMALDLKS